MKINEAAKAFHKKAEIKAPELSEPVVEAAHQPLFLPPDSFFNKIRKASELGCCVFGFIDTDVSLFPALSEAKIPSKNKNGYEKIGFKIKDKRKLFKNNPKPTLEEIEKIERRIKSKELREIVNHAFEHADNAAEFNAITLAKTSNELLGLNAAFFLYSRALKQKLFEHANRELLEKRNLRDAYNSSLTASHGKIKPLAEKEIPFWLECKCGCNSRAFLYGKTVAAECAECGKKQSHDLNKIVHALSPKAITRNLVVPKSIGASVYVSGAGAFSEKQGNYGSCANHLAESLKWPMPEIVVLKRSHEKGEEDEPSTAELEKRVDSLKDKINHLRAKESRAISTGSASERMKIHRQKRELLKELDSLNKQLHDAHSLFKRSVIEFSIASEL